MQNYATLLVFLLCWFTSSCSALRLTPLLSTCIDACQKGCHEIRKVQQKGGIISHELKDENDPKSALTEADRAAQQVILQSLRAEWGDELNIIGEEEEDDDDDDAVNISSPLDRTLLNDDYGDEGDDNDEMDIDISTISIFVDPLDGTREFVEGRLENVQCLIGIAIDGEAVAGAMGIPFPSNNDDKEEGPTIVYGISGVGAGVLGTPLKRGPIPLVQHRNDPQPHYACGDAKVPVMKACKKALIWEHGGSAILYGGAGNKALAAALGTVKCSFSHKIGGPWDLCAPQAIVQAMGGTMTDLFGQPINIYRDPTCNVRGFLATPPGEEIFHERTAKAFLKQEEVQQYEREITVPSS